MRVITRVLAATAIAGLTVLGTSAAAQAAPAGTDGALSHPCDDSGACAVGTAIGSPGVLSGNVIQIPIDLDVNACGNSINVVGLLNPAFGNTCVND
ncbi:MULTISPECIES: chaplin [Streptomyces]|uniref:Chaplin n=2 Tax=Streptomyces TaxID=1883 RepID=A0A2U9P069_STRAS|nr:MULTISPECIES: chaplin [Streptomyces]AWT42977.1 chaplin [Streptomyces actuosus]MBM4824892.1 chaplin [Streptomyces actuosus]GHF71274.1 membrane protein [Streptomyces griseosporeus]